MPARRIRLQSLPFLGKPEEARQVVGEWPAYRVSQGTVMTMQHRIADCYWQMRLPLIDYGSDVTVALTLLSRQPGQGRRDHRARPSSASEDSCMKRSRQPGRRAQPLSRLGAYLLLRGQSAASIDTAIKSSWASAAPDWQARLVQDETQKACSQYRNAPPKAVADAILAREKATIAYPADGKLMGDWKNGEKLAQSGYGGRFTDYPPRAENGGNCYACHQLDAKELSFGTLGPSLARIRQDPQVRRGRGQGRSTSGSTTRRPPFRAGTCRAWAPASSSPSSRSRIWWHS